MSHGSGNYACPQCTCVFTNTKALKRHSVLYHKILENTTDVSGNDSTVIRNASEEECETPPKVPRVNRNFLKIRSMSSTKRNLSRKMSSPIKLKDAEIESTPAISPRYYCSTDSFYSLHSFKALIKITKRRSSHTSNNAFKCNLCMIKFNSKSIFENHQMVRQILFPN